MAIDTPNKRRSVQAYSMGQLRPAPDGAIDASDRACAAWFYSGLTYGTPSLITTLAAQFHNLFHMHHNIPRFN